MNFTLCPGEVDRIIMLPLAHVALERLKVKQYSHKHAHVFVRSQSRQNYLEKHVMQGFKYSQVPSVFE